MPTENNGTDLHLVEFARLLRELGIRASASEIHDAMQGLVLVGLVDKERVEAVLQATLVKAPNQIPWFQEAFRAFFFCHAGTEKGLGDRSSREISRLAREIKPRQEGVAFSRAGDGFIGK